MPNITPFLWFDHQAEEAARFYAAIFPNSKVGKITRYPEGAPGPAGGVMTVEFELDGRPFIALNGGPHFAFTEAVSFVIDCRDQAEVDHYWNGLLEGGGRPSQCGWLKDRYGLSWQVTPVQLNQLVERGSPEQAQRVFQAMLGMVKLDVAALEAAFEGRTPAPAAG